MKRPPIPNDPTLPPAADLALLRGQPIRPPRNSKKDAPMTTSQWLVTDDGLEGAGDYRGYFILSLLLCRVA